MENKFIFKVVLSIITSILFFFAIMEQKFSKINFIKTVS